MRSCGPIRARSCCSWARSSRRNANGTSWPALTGLRSTCRRTAACRQSCATATRLPFASRIARRRLSRRRIPMDRRRRRAPRGLRLAAPGPGRRAARRRRLQFHAVAAPGLPHRTAAAGPVARDPQHRFGAVRRIECRQCRGGRGARDACHGFPFSAKITVPPLGTVWFLHDGE